MDEIFNRLFQNDFLSIPLSDQLLVIGASILCGVLIGLIYIFAHNGASYSRSFTITVVLITPLVASVMLVIGSSIVRAFTLLGALALIRFRNAVKEPWDTAIIFWAVVVGMTIGSKLYGFALVILVSIGALLLVLTKTNFGVKHKEIMVRFSATKSQYVQFKKAVSCHTVSVESHADSPGKKDDELVHSYTVLVSPKIALEEQLARANILEFTIFADSHY